MQTQELQKWSKLSKMEITNIDWLLGFFEGSASFSVNIGLAKSKNKRYVVFKPYIVVCSLDREQMKYIAKLLGINFVKPKLKSKTKNPYYSDSFSINIQNFADIDLVLEKLSGNKFKSKIKQDKLDKFVACYDYVKEIGHIHTEWKNEFETLIDLKLDINSSRSNIGKNRFNKAEWVKKIKKHL